MVIVQQLKKQLPPGFVSGPKVHQGALDLEASYEKTCDDLSVQ